MVSLIFIQLILIKIHKVCFINGHKRLEITIQIRVKTLLTCLCVYLTHFCSPYNNKKLYL